MGKYLDKVWREEWGKTEGHRQTKFWLSGPDSNLANILIRMNRKSLGSCLQFFTGHGWWKRHLNLAKLDNDSECRLCMEEDETPMHLYNDCEAIKWDRMKILGSFYDPPVPSTQYSVSVVNVEWQQVIDFVQIDDIQSLISFVQQTSKIGNLNVISIVSA